MKKEPRAKGTGEGHVLRGKLQRDISEVSGVLVTASRDVDRGL